MLCNLHDRDRGSDSLREQPGYEYGPDVPPEEHSGPPYWGNYGILGGETFFGPEGPVSGSTFTDHSTNYGSRGEVPVPRPHENRPPLRVNPYEGSFILVYMHAQ